MKLAGETKLAKMNNHVGSFFANNEIISREEVIAIKQALVKALSQPQRLGAGHGIGLAGRFRSNTTSVAWTTTPGDSLLRPTTPERTFWTPESTAEQALTERGAHRL